MPVTLHIAGSAPAASAGRAGPVVIGWREWVSLPQLDIARIKAKIDTGARTSALHAFQIDPFTRAGEPWVRFAIHPRQRDMSEVRVCEARIIDRRNISDSSGHRQLRYVIETRIKLGEDCWPIELTLAARDTMAFRMLLGRSAIQGRFLLDPAHSFRTGSKFGIKPQGPKP